MKARRAFPIFLVAVLLWAAWFTPVVLAPYRDYSYLINDFKTLANAHSDLMTYRSVGKTVLNNDILMFEIGNPAGEKVLFDGGMHGTENIGGELLYLYATWLLTSGEPLASRILAGTRTMLVPAVNVDRYNRDRTNANGVDLNRNFATGWDSGGSTDPESDTYRGPTPLSEPESQTLVRLFQNYKPQFYVNLHMWAGPYYAGSRYANRTYYSYLTSQISSLCKERGATPYPYSGEFGGGGMALSDAAVAGVTSFLIELTTEVIPFSELETRALPRFIPVAAVLSQQNQQTDVIFQDDFESGTLSSWSGSTVTTGDSATVTNTISHDGTQCGEFQTESIASGTKRAFVYKNIEEDSTIYARGYFYIADGLSLTDENDRFTLIQFLGTDGNIICNLQVRKSQGMDSFALFATGGDIQIATAAHPELDTWYCLELYAHIDSENGAFKAYINGVESMSLVNVNNTGFGGVLAVRFGLANSINVQQRVKVFVDSTVISKSYIGFEGSTKPWDLNADHRIDILDLTIVSLAFRSTPTSPNWNPQADLNSNGIIDITDLATVSSHYSEVYT